MPILKPWTPCEALKPKELPGTVGVYELGDPEGQVIYVGYAGGRSLMGLRGTILAHCAPEETNTVIRERCHGFRFEVTTGYLIRRLELLSRYVADNGQLPAANAISGESLPPLACYRW